RLGRLHYQPVDSDPWPDRQNHGDQDRADEGEAMKRRRSGEHGGSSFLEFVVVGVPVIFVLFSTFEMARGMWSYHTLAYAVREGTRYASVHGADCASSPNACTVTVGQIATVVKRAVIGLDGSVLS